VLVEEKELNGERSISNDAADLLADSAKRAAMSENITKFAGKNVETLIYNEINKLINK